MRKVSAKINSNVPSSNSEAPAPRSRDNSVDPPQRYGASAYMDQSEYDAYKQPTMNSSPQVVTNDGGNRGAYATYMADHNKNRYIDDARDDDYSTTVNNEYLTGQQSYSKTTSTNSYSGLSSALICLLKIIKQSFLVL